MRRLPNGHVRPTSEEKIIFAQLLRVLPRMNEWFALDDIIRRLASIGTKATLEQADAMVRHLRRGDRGFIMEEREVDGLQQWRLVGQRDEVKYRPLRYLPEIVRQQRMERS